VNFSKIGTFLRDIKFEHSIFALPFAYMTAILVPGLPTWWQIVWITVAMVGARTLAMSLNRLIDRNIDARNPRTRERALPTGLISVREVLVYGLFSFIVFMIAVFQLAPLCRYLWPLVIIPFVVYPYTKRFTWVSHFVLGFNYSLVPLGAWVAITNRIDVAPAVLGLAAALWPTGFDIIYSCQDVEVDRAQGLFSIPANFGIRTGLSLTRLLHLLTVLLLVLTGVLLELGLLYYGGVMVAAAFLYYENSLVKPYDLSRLNLAFFTMNGLFSMVLFLFTLADVLVRSW
jgi:4-hydroxybenzoate polyprenyltransferase